MTLQTFGTPATGRVPSIARNSNQGSGILAYVFATALSLWPRRSHPPNVPEFLREDLGLPPEYELKRFHQLTLDTTLRRRIDHE
ncbi:MAG TPA: hypothetical protein VGM83_10640 [Devosiaceae bacterium]|jgi:hypothetical protein